jgi:hypothetical protein
MLRYFVAILSIPEVVVWPELGPFLLALNDERSPIESVGCECAFFPDTDDTVGPGTLGSYIDVIFTDRELNSDPKLLLGVASHLTTAMAGCEQWWGSMELGLERLKDLPGVSLPWGLQARVTSRGRTQQEARKLWGYSLEVLVRAITNLPSSYVAPSN